MSINESISKRLCTDFSERNDTKTSLQRNESLLLPEQLIQFAKVTQPASSGLFQRQRLFHLLDACRKSPVIWISAPAGSGKTTLVSSYLSSRQITSAWYKVDEGDADLATFFYYMSLAAQKAALRKRNPLPLFTPEYRLGIQAFTLRFFENLYDGMKAPFIIVFDNYQHVSDQSGFQDMIREGLDIIPEGMNVILISRNRPPPQFARLRASGKLSFLRTDQLNFTFDESEKLLKHKRLDQLPHKAICGIHDRTRGWAAGLVLMAEIFSGNGADCEALADHTPQEVFDYFSVELFQKMERDVRDFLLKTSFLPWIPISIAEKLTGASRSAEILTLLHRDHFFTEKNTHSDPVYQYHPLFRDFLQTTALSVMAREDIQQIRLTSAGLLEESGRIEDAVSLFIEAGEWEKITRLICLSAQSLIAQGRSETLEGWLLKIPAAISGNIPWLLYWMGVCRMAYNPVESRGSFEKAFHGFSQLKDPAGECLAWAGIVDSILIGFDDFKLLDPWIEWMDNRKAEGVPFPSPDIEARVASCMTGSLTWRSFHRTDIKFWMQRALVLSSRTNDVNLKIAALNHAIVYSLHLGDFERIIDLGEQAKEIALSPKASPFNLLFWKVVEPVTKGISPIRYTEIVSDITESLKMAKKTGVHIFDFWLIIQGVWGALLARDVKAARDFLQILKNTIREDCRQFQAQYHLVSAWNHLMNRELSNGLISIRKCTRIFQQTGATVPMTSCYLTIAELLFDTGEHDEAMRTLGIAGKLAGRFGEESLHCYLFLLQGARFRLARGEERAGLELLGHAMFIGRKRNFMTMLYLWRPEILAPLFAKALEHGIESQYALEFIHNYKLFPEKPPVRLENWPWHLKIYTLGKFELYLDGIPLNFSGKLQKKPLLLLKSLIALGGRNVREEHLTDLLWPEADGDHAHSAFTSTVLRLRRLVGLDKAIEINKGRASLNPKYCWVDIWAFEEMHERVKSGLKNGGVTYGDENFTRMVEQAVRMYGGCFLPEDGNQSWVLPLRGQMLEKFTSLVIRLGAELEAAAEWEKAAECYKNALNLDEIADEKIYRCLMALYRRFGMPDQAIEVYRRCQKTLAITLSVKPSPKTEALYKELMSSD